MNTYLSDDVALHFINEGDVPHVKELTQVVQDAVATVGYPRHTSIHDVACGNTASSA